MRRSWHLPVRGHSRLAERLRQAIDLLKRVLRFLLSGLPAFLLAIPANWFLVEVFHWPKPVSYLAVLWGQTTINFFACRRFVFNLREKRPTFRQYWQFLSGMGLFRLADWLLYTIVVEVFRLYYLAAQLFNIAVFALIKFKFAESLFEARKKSLTAKEK